MRPRSARSQRSRRKAGSERTWVFASWGYDGRKRMLRTDQERFRIESSGSAAQSFKYFVSAFRLGICRILDLEPRSPAVAEHIFSELIFGDDTFKIMSTRG